LDNYSFSCGHVKAACHILRERANCKTKFAFFGSVVFGVLLFVTKARSVELSAVGDGDLSILFLAISNIANRHLCAWLAAGYIGNQFVAVLNCLTIDRDNRIADFQATLFSGTARSYVGDGNA